MHIDGMFRRVLALLALTLVPAIAVIADGGFFSLPTLPVAAASADQRSIIVRQGDQTCMILSTGYTGDGDDFAWIIPTPAAPKIEDVREAGELGEKAFEVLDTITSIKVPEWWTRSSAIAGVRGGVASEEWLLGVTVYGRVDLEHYEVSILGAKNTTGLLAWLDREGYEVNASARTVLDGYIRERWAFVAVKLAPGAARHYENELLPPIALTYRSSQFVFPMRISAVSTLRSARI
jgi:hypothetical protein